MFHLDLYLVWYQDLAFYLSTKISTKIQAMKLFYEDELARALAEDGSASSTHITPKTYYPEHNVKIRNR